MDDDLRSACLLVDVGAGAEGDLAAAGAVAVEDALPAADDAAGGEVGAGDDLDQLVERDVGVVDETDEAVADLAQVVRRDFGGHADGDAVGAVDEQVGELARQDQRLAILAVVVVDEVDRVVARGRRASRRRPGTGVPRCSAWAAGGRPAMEPKLPCGWTRRCRMFQSWAMRTRVG